MMQKHTNCHVISLIYPSINVTQYVRLSLTFFFCVFVAFPVLSPCPVAAARRCHSIYKGFAQCLMALGDSLTDSARKDEDTHEIHSICRSECSNTHFVPFSTHTQPQCVKHPCVKDALFTYSNMQSTQLLYERGFKKQTRQAFCNPTKCFCYLISIGRIKAVGLYNTTDRSHGSLIPHQTYSAPVSIVTRIIRTKIPVCEF